MSGCTNQTTSNSLVLNETAFETSGPSLEKNPRRSQQPLSSAALEVVGSTTAARRVRSPGDTAAVAAQAITTPHSLQEPLLTSAIVF